MKKKMIVIGVACVVLLACALGFWLTRREEPQTPKVIKFERFVADKSDGSPRVVRRVVGNAPPEMMEKIKQELPPNVMPDLTKLREEKLQSFFAMSPAEQESALDKAIDEEAMKDKILAGLQLPDGLDTTQMNIEVLDFSLKPDGSTKNLRIMMTNPGGPSGTAFGNDENGKNREVERNKRQIDNSSPNFRAMKDEYDRRLQEHRNRRQ